MPISLIKISRGFPSYFKKTIEEKESKLGEQRKLWKTIAANILLALTGIGLLAQIIKFEAYAHEASQQKKPISFNKCLFFAKPKSLLFSEEVKDTVDLIKNETLNLSACEFIIGKIKLI